MTKTLIIDVESHSDVDPQVIEYGQVVLHTEPPAAAWYARDAEYFRFRPSVPIEPGAMAVHGITDMDVAHDVPFSLEAVAFDADYIIGHSVDFDWGAIGQPDVKRICTLALARKVWPDAKTHKLMALVFMLDVQKGRELFPTAHGVETDIEACFFVLVRICIALQPASIEDLWRMSEEARIPEIMTFGMHKGKPMHEVPRGWRSWYMNQPDPDHYLIKAFEKYPTKW